MNTRIASFALSLTLLAGLSGCYKTDFQNEQKKSADLQTQLDAMKADLDAAKKRAADAQVAVSQLASFRNGSGVMNSFGWNNGQWTLIGQDAVRLNENGAFVRHGDRKRENGALRYTNGALADQTFSLVYSGTTTKAVEGSIKGGKADGEWTWYSKEGKPTHRETFAGGKLASVETVSTAKDGKVSYKKLGKADADKFSKAKSAMFVSIPELDRSI